MKTASFFLLVFWLTTPGAQASMSRLPSLALPASAMVHAGFPATRCRNFRLSETQRRHCDKAMRKAASKT